MTEKNTEPLAQQTSFSSQGPFFEEPVNNAPQSDMPKQQEVHPPTLFSKTVKIGLLIAGICIVLGIVIWPKRTQKTDVDELPVDDQPPAVSVDPSLEKKIQELQKQFDETDPTRTTLGVPPVEFTIRMDEIELQ